MNGQNRTKQDMTFKTRSDGHCVLLDLPGSTHSGDIQIALWSGPQGEECNRRWLPTNSPVSTVSEVDP